MLIIQLLFGVFILSYFISFCRLYYGAGNWKLEKRHQYCFKIYFSNPDTKSQLYVNYMIELIRQTVQSRMLEILLYNENHTTTSQALEHFATVASSRLSFILIEFSVHALFLSALHFLSKRLSGCSCSCNRCFIEFVRPF